MPPSVTPKHAQSLANELIAGDLPRPKHRKRKSLHDEDGENGTGRELGYVDSKASRKILKLGQDLAEEENAIQKSSADEANKQRAAFGFRVPAVNELEDDEGEDNNPDQYDDDEAWEEEVDVEEIEVDPEDLAAFNKFLPSHGEQPGFDISLADAQPRKADGNEEDGEEEEGTDLASLILQKIAEHEATGGTTGGAGPGAEAFDEDPEEAVEIPEKVLEVFRQIGGILSRYKSGKLPKPVKVLPTLPHWRELLMESAPERWTANATYAVTKIFASARPQIVKEFYEHVLLPSVRENINDTKKLNVHLYKALQKATYKPASFFKGIVFPIIRSGTCTLREAHIVGSIVTRSSIPPLHASAAMLELTDLAAEQASSVGTENSGSTNIFLKAFLEKGYALPYKVVDNLVFHFLRFRAVAPSAGTDRDAMTGISGQGNIEGKLPVLWHQCLLAFAQRYKDLITEDQREALLDLLQERGHRDIGPEVRRELLAGRGRGVVVPEAKFENGGDDTMDMGA